MLVDLGYVDLGLSFVGLRPTLPGCRPARTSAGEACPGCSGLVRRSFATVGLFWLHRQQRISAALQTTGTEDYGERVRALNYDGLL